MDLGKGEGKKDDNLNKRKGDNPNSGKDNNLNNGKEVTSPTKPNRNTSKSLLLTSTQKILL